MTTIIAYTQTLEDAGYVAYWHEVKRCDLVTEAEKRGWDDAHGEDCYYRAMWDEQYAQDCIDHDESRYPFLY